MFFLRLRRTLLVSASLAFCLITVSVVSAASGAWYKNGAQMSGQHSTLYINPLDKSMTSSSAAQTPRGAIQLLMADARLEDRCRNQNGSWRPWRQLAYGNRSASWAYTSGSAYARGTYQNCAYGHEYRNKSLHHFYDPAFGLNQNYWLQTSN